MKCICEYNPDRDAMECNQHPEFECDIEKMLATGMVGEQANNLEFNEIEVENIGDRCEDIFDVVERMKGIKPAENNE